MLAGRSRAKILPHCDCPDNRRRADAQAEQQKQRQLGAARVAARGRALESHQRQQYRQHAERQQHKQHIADQRERQVAPLFRREPAHLVVRVAKATEQRELGGDKAEAEGSHHRQFAEQLRFPLPPVPDQLPPAGQQICHQVVQRHLFIQVEQVGKSAGRRAPANAGAGAAGGKGAQHQVNLPQRKRKKHVFAHKADRDDHRGAQRHRRHQEPPAGSGNFHPPQNRIRRKNRARRVHRVEPPRRLDLQSRGGQRQRRQQEKGVKNLLVIAGHIAHHKAAPVPQAAGDIQIPQLVAVDGDFMRVGRQQTIPHRADNKQQANPLPSAPAGQFPIPPGLCVHSFNSLKNIPAKEFGALRHLGWPGTPNS